jgi:aryl-alcohol dehydrogenase-like predicted oxidoreductase
MRYRPFGAMGKAVSAVSLLLREAPNMATPQAWRTVVFAAMESGINCFELTAGADVMALGVGEALGAVERRLMFVAWRLRPNPAGTLSAKDIADSVRGGLQKTRAGHFDLLVIDEPAYEMLTPDGLSYLSDLRAAKLCLELGVAGDGATIDTCIRSGLFNVLVTPFSLVSDWEARRRIRDASAADMTLVASDPIPTGLDMPRAARAPLQRRGLLAPRAEPLAGSGTYAFLQATSGWTAEEICLAYALTEPAFSTVQIEANRAETLGRLAAVPDRDMPTGVAAQIEMARFGAIGGHKQRA